MPKGCSSTARVSVVISVTVYCDLGRMHSSEARLRNVSDVLEF